MYPFSNFSQDMINHFLPGQRAMQDILVSADSNIQTVTSGALSLTIPQTNLSVTGTQAFTLAAPTTPGQRKKVVCSVAATTPAGTLTVSSPDDSTGFVCPATFFFDTVGQTLEFEATNALKWRCINKIRVGSKTLVVGTTVTTGICDMSHISLSITGTVSSTTTMALPNGAAVGEIVSINVSTAASIPSGTLGGTYLSKTNAAATGLAAFTLITDNVTLQWSGAAWKVISVYGAMVAS